MSTRKPVTGCLNVNHNAVDCRASGMDPYRWCEPCWLSLQETDDCPLCGSWQNVVGSYATSGADPYNVNKLACGHDVACFGPGEANVVVRTRT